MSKPVLYLVGRYPALSETFIDREIAGLRRMGLDLVVQPLDWRPAPHRHGQPRTARPIGTGPLARPTGGT